MHSNVSSWPPPLKSFLAPPNKIQYNTIYSKHFVSRKVVDCSRISDTPSKNVAGYVPVNGNYNRHSFLKGWWRTCRVQCVAARRTVPVPHCSGCFTSRPPLLLVSVVMSPTNRHVLAMLVAISTFTAAFVESAHRGTTTVHCCSNKTKVNVSKWLGTSSLGHCGWFATVALTLNDSIMVSY